MAIDPICGMKVDEATALSAERDGETYYFCCEHCRRKFLEQSTEEVPHAPDHDLRPAPDTRKTGKGKYVCPMCEGVESDGPGDCPKCGMALEPAQPAARKRKTKAKATRKKRPRNAARK